MMGGGAMNYVNRTDGLNLIKYAEDKGYTVVQTLTGMNSLDHLPAIGLFASSAMPYAIDPPVPDTPTLPQMTAKALELMKGSPNGFMLMIEGSKIDFAGHNNDAATHWTEIIEYNQALKLVLDFAQNDGNTLVISTSDHETGGLTLGLQWDNETSAPYAWYPQVLMNFNASTEYMAKQILNNGQPIYDTILQNTGIQLTDNEIALIQRFTYNTTFFNALQSQIGKITSARARIGWTTWVHTGTDINLYAYGTQAEELRGHWQNTDVGTMVANLLNLDVQAITNKLSDFNPNPPTSKSTRSADFH